MKENLPETTLQWKVLHVKEFLFAFLNADEKLLILLFSVAPGKVNFCYQQNCRCDDTSANMLRGPFLCVSFSKNNFPPFRFQFHSTSSSWRQKLRSGSEVHMRQREKVFFVQTNTEFSQFSFSEFIKNLESSFVCLPENADDLEMKLFLAKNKTFYDFSIEEDFWVLRTKLMNGCTKLWMSFSVHCDSRLKGNLFSDKKFESIKLSLLECLICICLVFFCVWLSKQAEEKAYLSEDETIRNFVRVGIKRWRWMRLEFIVGNFDFPLLFFSHFLFFCWMLIWLVRNWCWTLFQHANTMVLAKG